MLPSLLLNSKTQTRTSSSYLTPNLSNPKLKPLKKPIHTKQKCLDNKTQKTQNPLILQKNIMNTKRKPLFANNLKKPSKIFKNPHTNKCENRYSSA
jgi:hypothetical protein